MLRLSAKSPAVHINSKDDFIVKVNTVIKIIKEVFRDKLDVTRPSPYAHRWWTKELSKLHVKQNKLSNSSYSYHHVPDHPSHAEHKAAFKELKTLLLETKKQNWIDWLEKKSLPRQQVYV